MANYRYSIIGRGHAGWHAQGFGWQSNPVRSSGGSLGDYLKDAVDGALVYDAIDAPYEDLYRICVRGPMCDPSLEPNGVRKFSGELRQVALRMVPGLSGAFQALALASQSEQFSGLDSVGVGVFEAVLRELPGIRIGHVKDGAVAWPQSPAECASEESP